MKQIWQIFKHGHSREIIPSFVLITILVIMSIACLVGINKCYGMFYDSLAQKSFHESIKYLIIYSSILVVVSVCDAEMHYQKRIFSAKLRYNLYHYYNTHVLDEGKCQFSCQRMSQDLWQFSSQVIHLFTVFLHSALLIPAFLYIVYSANVEWYILAFFMGISVVGSFVGKKIGKPVIRLQYNQESIEGGLRRKLIEQLNQAENLRILPEIESSNENFILLSKKERWLMYFKNIYDRFAHFLPYVILVPRYFADAISLGKMVQTGTGLSKLITEISVFVNNVDKIVEFTATVRRIHQLEATRDQNVNGL